MSAKKRPFLSLLAISAFGLSGCAVNLGAFEKSDGYKNLYESFGDVKGLYEGGDRSYDIETSLFNSYTIEKGSWKKEEDAVVSDYYLYLIIPTKKELTIESISLGFFTEQEGAELVISMFYFRDDSEVPTKIKYLHSPETKPIYDEDGNIIGEEPIEYDDELVGMSILEGSKGLTREQWNNFSFGSFNQRGVLKPDKYLHTNDGGYLYIRVENNSGWNVGRLSPITFTFINLLIRAI
jgi:hypothetical protein